MENKNKKKNTKKESFKCQRAKIHFIANNPKKTYLSILLNPVFFNTFHTFSHFFALFGQKTDTTAIIIFFMNNQLTFYKTLVQTQIMPDTVLPSGFVVAVLVIRVLLHDIIVNSSQRNQIVWRIENSLRDQTRIRVRRSFKIGRRQIRRNLVVVIVDSIVRNRVGRR